MTDEAVPEPAPDASSVAGTAQDVPPAKPIELPLASYVVDGTTTTAHDREMDRRWHESEARRDAIAADEGRAERFDRPTTETEDEAKRRRAVDTGGGALFVNKLTRHPEVPKAYVLLGYCNRSGAPIIGKDGPIQCLADIFTEDMDNPNLLTINLVCPRCMQRNKHQQEAQIKMRQDNRKWVLHLGQGPAEFMFDMGYGPRRYKSAGVVDSERFSCPGCSWRARIDKNRVIPD